MEGARSAGPGEARRGARRPGATPASAPAPVDAAAAARQIRKLEERMHQHARELEFEQAARLRDEIEALRARWLLAG
jgi:excinuclease ABC subunit B